MSQEIFLGRQPILDADRNVVAYELLFRSGQHGPANVIDDIVATTSVIANTIGRLGIDNVLGEKIGFFNLSYDMLNSDMLELLPPDRVVLEILETVAIDDRLIERCRELKARGYKLALDDFEYSPIYDPLLEIVDFIKFDLFVTKGEALAALVGRMKHLPVKLLAEKVETEEEYLFCKSLGMTLFQGYFFAKPVVLTSKSVEPEHATVLTLLSQLMRDVEITEIERTCKTSSGLSLNLLRLVNSVGIGLRSPANTLQRALVILGRQQLRRWAQLLIYTKNNPTSTNPILLLAAQRGMLMERLAEALPKSGAVDGDLKDRAFMVGMLSLVHVAIGVTMDEVLKQIPIPEDVKMALLRHEGVLGELLTIVELVEQSAFAQVADVLAKLQISRPAFEQAQLAAMQWAEGIGRETT